MCAEATSCVRHTTMIHPVAKAAHHRPHIKGGDVPYPGRQSSSSYRVEPDLIQLETQLKDPIHSYRNI